MNMKTCIAIMLGLLAVGCSQQPSVKGETSALTQAQAKKLATSIRDRWLIDNPRQPPDDRATFEDFVSAKQTTSGWHVVFSSSRNADQPEGQQTVLLHIYLDSSGKLERIEEAGEIS